MILESELEAIVARQREIETAKATGQPRPLAFNDILLDSHVLDISGVRRCGKSTVMRQRMRSGGTPWFYLNFESPLLVPFELRDTVRLDAIIARSGARRLFFDEVDQFAGWENYVRQKLDEGFLVCISGSNATLLEGDLATKLTGRHVSLELFPFSFAEYLEFTGTPPSPDATAAYLRDGGFPRFLQTREPVVLEELFDDIVYRDVIVHNKIRDAAALRELAAWLAENPACRFTASRMLRPLGVANASTVSQWCDWLEKAWLFFFVPVFTDSAKARLLHPRKTYCIDTGLGHAVSARRIPNDGTRFENLVFLALRRAHRDIRYFEGGPSGECDFVVLSRHAVASAVQACLHLTDESRDREIEGLVAAMSACGLDTGTIVTLDQRDTLSSGDRRIEVVPFHDWARSQP